MPARSANASCEILRVARVRLIASPMAMSIGSFAKDGDGLATAATVSGDGK